MQGCKSKCKNFDKISKRIVYESGGCYCRICDYYFKEKFLQCPCCAIRVRFKTRSNRGKSDAVRIT